MSNEHQKQPAGAGNAVSGSASGDRALSESSLDAVTGGAGESLNFNVEDNSQVDVIIGDKFALARITPESPVKPGGGTN